MTSLPGTKYWTDKFVANDNLELQIWDGLKFRTQVGNLAWGGDWGGYKGIDESCLPQTYEIDYVRVFQKP